MDRPGADGWGETTYLPGGKAFKNSMLEDDFPDAARAVSEGMTRPVGGAYSGWDG